MERVNPDRASGGGGGETGGGDAGLHSGDGAPDPLVLAPALRLVCITPPATRPIDRFEREVREAVAGGATAVMLRHPGMKADELVARGKLLARLAGELDFLFILNGPPEAAFDSGAGAVHLGSRTVDPAAARALLASRRAGAIAIGYSVHHPFEKDSAAIASCDYVTYSPVFPTASKPGARPIGVGEAARAVESLAVPVVALGGIDAAGAGALAAAGCPRVAVISSVFGCGDPRRGARALRDALDAAGPAGKEES